jgi:hypothetical protein
MALVTCEACGWRFPTEASACPRCGAPGPAEPPAVAALMPPRPARTPVRGLGLLSLLVAAAIGKFAGLGFFVLIAAVFGVVVLLILALGRVARPSSRPLTPAVAILLAQFLWVFGAAAYFGGIRSAAPHAAALLLGAIWLLLQPGWLIVGILCAYEGAAFVQQLIGWQALSMSLGEQASSGALGGLITMTLVRVCAVGAMITGLTTARRQAAARENLAVRLPDMLTWDELRVVVDQAQAGTPYEGSPGAVGAPLATTAARWDAVLHDVDFRAAQRALRRVLAEHSEDAAQDPDERCYPREYALALARFLAEPSSATAAPLLEASPSLQELFEQSKPGGIWTH